MSVSWPRPTRGPRTCAYICFSCITTGCFDNGSLFHCWEHWTVKLHSWGVWAFISHFYKCATHRWRHAVQQIQGRWLSILSAHTRRVPGDRQMAVTTATGWDVYCARVQPPFTLLTPATCRTCISYNLWCFKSIFSVVLVLQHDATDLRARDGREARRRTERRSLKTERTYTSLNSFKLVPGVNTSNRPITWREKTHQRSEFCDRFQMNKDIIVFIKQLFDHYESCTVFCLYM